MVPAGHAGQGRQGHSSGPWEGAAVLSTSSGYCEGEVWRSACEEFSKTLRLWKLFPLTVDLNLGGAWQIVRGGPM